jgi:hypothetical protein
VETRTVKTSTILISERGQTQLFRSRAELPEQLRSRLDASLSSATAATVLIADQKGRDEIMKLLRLTRAVRAHLQFAYLQPAQSAGRRGSAAANAAGIAKRLAAGHGRLARQPLGESLCRLLAPRYRRGAILRALGFSTLDSRLSIS